MLSTAALTILMAMAPVHASPPAASTVPAQAEIISGVRISLRSGEIMQGDGKRQAQPQRRIRNGEPLAEFL